MTPAAQNGIQAICSAHISKPGRPNSATSMTSIVIGPKFE